MLLPTKLHFSSLLNSLYWRAANHGTETEPSVGHPLGSNLGAPAGWTCLQSTFKLHCSCGKGAKRKTTPVDKRTPWNLTYVIIIEKLMFTASAEEGKTLMVHLECPLIIFLKNKLHIYASKTTLKYHSLIFPNQKTTQGLETHTGTEHQQDRSDLNTQAGEQTQVGQIRGTGVRYRWKTWSQSAGGEPKLGLCCPFNQSNPEQNHWEPSLNPHKLQSGVRVKRWPRSGIKRWFQDGNEKLWIIWTIILQFSVKKKLFYVEF